MAELVKQSMGWPWWAAVLVALARLRRHRRLPGDDHHPAGPARLRRHPGRPPRLAGRDAPDPGHRRVAAHQRQGHQQHGQRQPHAGGQLDRDAGRSSTVFGARMWLRDGRRRASGLVAPPAERDPAEDRGRLRWPASRSCSSATPTGAGWCPSRGVPWVVLIVLGVLAMWTLLLGRTKFGRYIYAIGGNAEAARRAGVNLACDPHARLHAGVVHRRDRGHRLRLPAAVGVDVARRRHARALRGGGGRHRGHQPVRGPGQGHPRRPRGTGDRRHRQRDGPPGLQRGQPSTWSPRSCCWPRSPSTPSPAGAALPADSHPGRARRLRARGRDLPRPVHRGGGRAGAGRHRHVRPGAPGTGRRPPIPRRRCSPTPTSCGRPPRPRPRAGGGRRPQPGPRARGPGRPGRGAAPSWSTSRWPRPPTRGGGWWTRPTGRGLLLTVFHNRRWDGDFLTVRRLVGLGRAGRRCGGSSRGSSGGGPEPPADAWRERADPTEGGGILLDLGSHLVDQALVLLGPAAVGVRRGGPASAGGARSTTTCSWPSSTRRGRGRTCGPARSRPAPDRGSACSGRRRATRCGAWTRRRRRSSGASGRAAPNGAWPRRRGGGRSGRATEVEPVPDRAGRLRPLLRGRGGLDA